MRLKNHRIKSLETRLEQAQAALKRGIKEVQLACPHRSVGMLRINDQLGTVCLSCGLSEYGPPALLISPGVHSITIEDFTALQRGLCLKSDEHKRAFKSGEPLASIFDRLVL